MRARARAHARCAYPLRRFKASSNVFHLAGHTGCHRVTIDVQECTSATYTGRNCLLVDKPHVSAFLGGTCIDNNHNNVDFMCLDLNENNYGAYSQGYTSFGNLIISPTHDSQLWNTNSAPATSTSVAALSIPIQFGTL